ncbi:DUF6431 domain-containing protein [Bacillus sp. ISL-18]
MHHELPDFLVPYKRYKAQCIESVLSNPSTHDVQLMNLLYFVGLNGLIIS